MDRASSEVTRRLERMVREAQAEARVPAMQVALHRGDRAPWTFHLGTSGTERPLDAETTFRIGSITKTFTATLVMQCRDDGLLQLDDPVSAYLPAPALGDATIRRILSHTAGIQREPHGDIWSGGTMPDAQQLLADLAKAEQVLPMGRRFHYSNLGYALLGQVITKLRGGIWFEILTDRILKPLQLTSIMRKAGPEAAIGYHVDAYSDLALPEPLSELGATEAAGQLWGTATDLARWAAFLADPATMDPKGAVLSAATLDEMRWPATMTNESNWAVGFGLGVMLNQQSNWVTHVGHSGAMPGFLANAQGRRGPSTPAAMGAAALGSSGTAVAAVELAHILLATAVELDPVDITPWQPGAAAPAHYQSVLGRWWSEGFEHIFSWREGEIRSTMAGAMPGAPPAVFAETAETDVLRAVSGREVGERLRLVRDESGQVTEMYWATYRLTRMQETFDGVPVSH